MASRKKFLQRSSLLLGGSVLASAWNQPAFALFKGGPGPSDQLNIGAIGINGMGWSNVLAALRVPGVNLAAVCDVDTAVIDRRLAELAKTRDTSKIKIYHDYRSLLDNKDIDAVIIGTPDHWHALIMIDACRAGKDVYVEKPVGNSIVECRAMVAAQQHYGRVVQGGQWQRSQQHFKDAVDFVHSWAISGPLKSGVTRAGCAPSPWWPTAPRHPGWITSNGWDRHATFPLMPAAFISTSAGSGTMPGA
jgi:predicted dehydrogenase